MDVLARICPLMDPTKALPCTDEESYIPVQSATLHVLENSNFDYSFLISCSGEDIDLRHPDVWSLIIPGDISTFGIRICQG